MATGASRRLQYVVSGGPDGETTLHTVLIEGKGAETAAGPVDDPSLTLAFTHDDWAKVLDGTLGVSVAFMQGRAKAVGDVSTLMALMPLVDTDDYRATLAGLA